MRDGLVDGPAGRMKEHNGPQRAKGNRKLKRSAALIHGVCALQGIVHRWIPAQFSESLWKI
ncbi:hypothetical protein ACRALDRAFT_2032891 [Sodiomyces alcalophilus JCM 7366]|uniref:uncharacterized protein n=1 Tax=Sodiomyces alcalophilus JCM 7366 TaxID=591952 RepID=UPI0039B476D6